MTHSPRQAITAKRTLRDSQPLWATTPHISVVSKKHVPLADYDVVIVGAGISGALMANALTDGTRSVLIIDRRLPVTGSSMASTAMIQHEIDIPLRELIGMIGEKPAGRIWRRSAKAVEELIELAGDLGIACSMKRKKTLYLAGDTYGARALEMEAAVRRAERLDAVYLSGQTVRSDFGLDRTGAILSDLSASANPAQLTAGILRHVRKRGAEIVSGVEITDVRSDGDMVHLATAGGKIIGCRHVVFCTGYEFLDGVAERHHAIISTWAIASEPNLKLPDWLAHHLVWEGSDPYLYFRTTKDGRLIAGGEDESDPEAHRSPEKLTRKGALIAEKVGDLLGCKIGKPAFSWAAAFGTTASGTPIIGEVPGMKHVHAVMGFGGNGITFSKIAADIVSSAIAGKPDADAALFGFPKDSGFSGVPIRGLQAAT
ncbi:NAD(P)/FAD-dependent oxidoreductase [Pararhizobium sp.]|uniref:NAD(P)/FAD-dependent oxidoreductase n=1 Tax=Pararhizobium sp. TaxID=1977563 RepID=UPI00271D427D|nr:FAD-binding oxidoreductase [Pararhizobium sp.]MDO9418438.1 FAD-binding oxidoreductase [Pararhizobium sp.]